jgi:hypothetical protein
MTRNTGNKECCGADASFQFFRSKQPDLRSFILARVPVERVSTDPPITRIMNPGRGCGVLKAGERKRSFTVDCRLKKSLEINKLCLLKYQSVACWCHH